MAHLGGGDAPRLRERGIISRLALLSFCTFCLISAVLVVIFVFQLVFTEFAPTLTGRMNPGAIINAMDATSYHPYLIPNTHQRKTIQSSVIQRFSMLRRAPTPQKGIDLRWTHQIFPHWFLPNGEINEKAVLLELALAVALLSKEEME